MKSDESHRRHVSANRPRIPRDMQAYLAARAGCADVDLPEKRDKHSLAKYRCYDLGSELEQLQEKYLDGVLSELLLVAP